MKSALIGLTQTLAIEGQSRNIMVNAIAPIATTRMTENIFPKEILSALSPKYIVPLVGVLAHEKCPESGSILEVGGGWIARVRW